MKSRIAIPALAVAIVSVTGLMAGPAFAGNTTSASSHTVEVAASRSATDVIKTLASEAIVGLTDQSLSNDTRRQNFVALMDRYFAMDVISRFVLGRYWRSISEEELNEFADLLQDYLALNYASQFKDFNGEQFVVGDEKQQNKDTFVNSQFVRPDGPPVSIVWRLREFGDEYKIIDVTVEGLSMGITQRDEFTAVIQKNGGEVSALTENLRAKVGK
ncbi:phospholipid-binding protein MlaC [Thalassospira xiamenensis]|uniref:MlaC/ttg2D family ABC transporter substrate-binding protein n=1 Tax=Thalassospira xiamenensis TaxID=220697 RepID=UPI00215D66B3|nr:ABC transporter substrate-binding protein [Thalassospira xiamenensis]